MGNDESGRLGDAGAAEPGSGGGGAPPPGGPGWLIWVANAQGTLIDPPTKENPGAQPDPGHPDAVDIYFGIDEASAAPPEQRDLQRTIAGAVQACRQTYLVHSPARPARFRMYFIRLFRIAQVGLQGERPHTGAAAAELTSLLSEIQAAPDDNAAAHTEILHRAAEAPAAPSTKGAYTIWVTNAGGAPIDPPTIEKPNVQPNPAHPDAADLYFGLMDSPDPPPKEQFALQVEIEKVLRVCQRLYLEGAKPQPARFRIYYTRLFHIARLGLQGNHPQPEVGAIGLASVTADLIDAEGATIKNGHLTKLGFYAIKYSALPLFVYLLIKMWPAALLKPWLDKLLIDSDLLSGFLLLWIGCFAGVWLSYGIRKTKFTLIDLTGGEDDRLAPNVRLLFAGLLTMLVGILFALKLVELSVGSVSLTDIAANPLVAFLIGAFCGISELALPASISKRASTLAEKL